MGPCRCHRPRRSLRRGAVPVRARRRSRTPRFRLGPVCDRSQLQELAPPARPVPLDPPICLISGDDLAWAIDPLSELAGALGAPVVVEPMLESHGGFFDRPPGCQDPDSRITYARSITQGTGTPLATAARSWWSNRWVPPYARSVGFEADGACLGTSTIAATPSRRSSAPRHFLGPRSAGWTARNAP